MKSVETLIDRAAKKCNSYAELARKVGVSPAIVSMMRSGKRQISPEMAAVLADIAGEDARQAAIDAVIEGARGTRREGVLREILGKALAAGVVGMLVTSYSGDSKAAMEKIAMSVDIASHPIHRIYCSLIRAWWFIKRCMGDSACADRAVALRVEPVTKAKPAANCFVRTSCL